MKILQRIKSDKAHAIVRGWSVKLLSTVVIGCMATSVGHTSDLEIYQASNNGNASIMMMLDNSISMGHSTGYDSIKDDYNIDPRPVQTCTLYIPILGCISTSTTYVTDNRNEPQRLYNDQGVDIGQFTYRVDYRTKNGQPYYDRMSRLKMALIPLLANPKAGFGEEVDLSKYKIGLGSFSGSGGRIDAQITDLTLANRRVLINKIIALEPTTTTPVANAYAEAGAYMLGTKTSATSSAYTSPMPNSPAQCDGYGIYFLTDGEPNGVSSESNTRSFMNTSLVGGSRSIGSSCQSGLNSAGTVYQGSRQGSPGWECIGEYARALYSKDNAKKDNIATATVGFGKVYQQLKDIGTRPEVITRPGKPPETVQVYNCDASGISQDAKNLCKLGEKGYDHGEGGFYYTKESGEIAASVKSFIEEVGSKEIQSISTGTMSVPLDSLGGLKSRKFAYLPILEPVPGSQRLWNGNLKKYNVKNGTLVGKDGGFVFADNTGLFSRDSINASNENDNAGTYDLWNTINIIRPDTAKPDGGLPQVGGAYQQIFENADAPIVGDRNLFVNTGNSLTNLKVTNQKPINFMPLAGYTNPQKLTLLGFMGYNEPTGTTINNSTTLTVSKNKLSKNIGGVLHSTPQLITQSVEVDAFGQFDTRTRKDYIIYGSMDGALHMLDDSTGKETFTFVPKQILDLQPDALTGTGTAAAIDRSYPYGVDAPWQTYVSYTIKKTQGEGANMTTTNTYEAAQSFALGGLRMGGSMYYALDITNVNEPKMIYSVGSNYANRQKGSTAVLSGTRNGTTNNTANEQAAYARMGQTWGKPTLGYVKRDGERVMVSFLPGGYDDCYEDPRFKLATTVNTSVVCSKTAAQGNAMYMVEMGAVETDEDSQEETVKTSANSGKLLWWASNNGTSTTARSPNLQYSNSADLKHSIVTQVRAVDRNYDGLTDHIYFADLGGQVWRADINNNEDTENFKVDRVVKVLDVSDQIGTGDAPPRIYERPLITFYNGKYSYKEANNNTGTYSGVQAMITVGTGDRSSPVSAERNKPDALYTFIDKDVSRRDLFYYGTGTAPTISLRTPTPSIKVDGTGGNKLQPLMFTGADIGDNGIRKNMNNNVVQGWYMPFNTWLGGTTQITGPYKMKMFNEPDALAGVLISSSYNPDVGQNIQSCSAGVKGSTQRERTCLPYGVCLDASGSDVLTGRSTFNAGSGIVDNIISQYNDTTIFGSLVNRCEGDECKPEPICRNGNCSYTSPTVNSGINVDKRINPLSWMEH